MAFPIALLLPALIPVVADGLRGVFNRVTGGAGVKPTTTTEAIEFMKAEAEMAKAMATLDQPAPNISRWVADLRASFRYIAAGVLILAPYIIVLLQALELTVANEVLLTSLDARDAAFSFIFGDRMYKWLRR